MQVFRFTIGAAYTAVGAYMAGVAESPLELFSAAMALLMGAAVIKAWADQWALDRSVDWREVR